MYKFMYTFDTNVVIPGTGPPTYFAQSAFNSMTLYQTGNFLGLSASETAAPVGLNYWSSVYQEGRVEAIKFEVEFINEGQNVIATGALVSDFKAWQIAIAAEGPSHITTSEPIVNANYWQANVVRKQRWARTATITNTIAQPKKTLKLFVRCKDLQPDKTERDESCTFNIASPFNTPGTGDTGIVSFSAPTELHRVGFGISAIDGLTLPEANQQIFAIRVKATVFAHYWDKVPNTQIS